MKYLKEGSNGNKKYTAIAEIKVTRHDPVEADQPSIVCTFACGLGSMRLVGEEMCTAFLDDFESPTSHIIDFTSEDLPLGATDRNYIERFDAEGNIVGGE